MEAASGFWCTVQTTLVSNINSLLVFSFFMGFHNKKSDEYCCLSTTFALSNPDKTFRYNVVKVLSNKS